MHRPSVAEARTVGVAGLVNELFNALNSSLNRLKLRLAFFVGLLGGLVLTLVAWLPHFFDEPWPLLGTLTLATLLLALTSLCAAVLTQMTFVELSRLRAARSREIKERLVRRTARLFLTLLVVGVVAGGLLYAVRESPTWFRDDLQEAAGAGALSLRLILEFLAWPVLGMALLLGPIVVIEDGSVWRSLREWLALLRQHLSRVFLYETLAVALGVVLTLPLLFPVWWAYVQSTGPHSHLFALVRQATLSVLTGVALTPLIAYLFVANVFIYLNLKYEFAQNR